jgi:hypothetical protein
MEATKKSAEPDLGTLVERQFVEAMSLASAEVHRARNFETDLVSHLNENAKSVDQMFVFSMSSHCEGTHDGMLRVFTDMAKSLRMIDVDEGEGKSGANRLGKSSLLPNTKKRKIHLCVDQLSAKMFRHLKLNLTKKLTELGSGEYVEPLLEALEQFTVQHDYLHEHRMHRQDVIWKQFYGCVLQAFR